MTQVKPRSYHVKFKFLIEDGGFVSAGFNKCSELSVEAAKIAYYEGCSLISHKSPGRLTYSDITLERGATEDEDMNDWFKTVGVASVTPTKTQGAGAGSGTKDIDYKRNLSIVQLDRDGETLRRWNIFGAWPTKYVAGEWDNDSDEKVIEMVTLPYDYFELAE